MNIPDFMPVLSAGAHQSPAQGACIMEYASFLNGEEWTDFPSCTNPILARAAQYANDELDDETRQQLLPLLPRLMGTGDHSEEVNMIVAEAAARYVAPLVGHSNWHVNHYAKEAQIDFYTVRNPRFTILDAHSAVAQSKGDFVHFISHLIDVYDKVTGRTEPAVVTEDDLRRCAELTGARA